MHPGDYLMMTWSSEACTLFGNERLASSAYPTRKRAKCRQDHIQVFKRAAVPPYGQGAAAQAQVGHDHKAEQYERGEAACNRQLRERVQLPQSNGSYAAQPGNCHTTIATLWPERGCTRTGATQSRREARHRDTLRKCAT